MCGIAGIFNLNGEPASPNIIKKMTDSIAHRGPDGEGHYIDGPLGLGIEDWQLLIYLQLEANQ